MKYGSTDSATLHVPSGLLPHDIAPYLAALSSWVCPDRSLILEALFQNDVANGFAKDTTDGRFAHASYMFLVSQEGAALRAKLEEDNREEATN